MGEKESLVRPLCRTHIERLGNYPEKRLTGISQKFKPEVQILQPAPFRLDDSKPITENLVATMSSPLGDNYASIIQHRARTLHEKSGPIALSNGI